MTKAASGNQAAELKTALGITGIEIVTIRDQEFTISELTMEQLPEVLILFEEFQAAGIDVNPATGKEMVSWQKAVVKGGALTQKLFALLTGKAPETFVGWKISEALKLAAVIYKANASFLDPNQMDSDVRAMLEALGVVRQAPQTLGQEVSPSSSEAATA